MTFSGRSSRYRRRRDVVNGEHQQQPLNGANGRATARPRPLEPEAPREFQTQLPEMGETLRVEPLEENGVDQPAVAVRLEAEPIEPTLVEPTMNGFTRPEPAEEDSEPQPVRFRWDPKTGQAVPVSKA